MPCLNEAETLATCVGKAQRTIEKLQLRGENVVADNGSTAASPDIAERMGARVVRVQTRGYGSALQGGIAAASGALIVMGDADDSYDFTQMGVFVDKLREGYDVVLGNRFKGDISRGAMPPSHKYLGNPILTRLGKLFFKSPCGDFHCGLRAFRKDVVQKQSLESRYSVRDGALCLRQERCHALASARQAMPEVSRIRDPSR